MVRIIPHLYRSICRRQLRNLLESIQKFYSNQFCSNASLTSFSANNGPGVNRVYTSSSSAFCLFGVSGSAHRVFNLHVLRSCASSIFTCFFFYYMTQLTVCGSCSRKWQCPNELQITIQPVIQWVSCRYSHGWLCSYCHSTRPLIRCSTLCPPHRLSAARRSSDVSSIANRSSARWHFRPTTHVVH